MKKVYVCALLTILFLNMTVMTSEKPTSQTPTSHNSTKTGHESDITCSDVFWCMIDVFWACADNCDIRKEDFTLEKKHTK